MRYSIISLSILMVGCTSEQVQKPEADPVVVQQVNPEPALPPPPAEVQQITLRNVMLEGLKLEEIAVSDISKIRTNDGYLKAQVQVKNVSASLLRTKYRFDWLDGQGVVLRDVNHDVWEKRQIDVGDVEAFTSIAPRRECVDFKLRLKPLR